MYTCFSYIIHHFISPLFFIYFYQIKGLDALDGDLTLVPGKIKYHGPKSLLDLEVQDVKLVSKGPRCVSVEVELKRKCFYHLATTYFPTLCLLLIVEVLLFVPESHFEAILMVSLTIMLVMYTLYQSILGTLPQTSYLKMIDVWLMTCTTIPFLVFIAEVLSNVVKYQQNIVQGSSTTSGTKSLPGFPTTIKVLPAVEKENHDQGDSNDFLETVKSTNQCNSTKEYEPLNRKMRIASFFVSKKKIIIPLITGTFISVLQLLL
jgi:hypothetical protein